MAKRAMTPAERFFWKHSGVSYQPSVETRAQGRRRGAENLARAEAEAEARGWVAEWKEDDLSLDDVNHDEWCKPDCGKSHEILWCVLRPSADSLEVLASLGGIVDADRTYGRVVEAELALEALAEIERGDAGRHMLATGA